MGSSVNNTMQKPVNSFLLFCKEHRSTVQTENPGYSNADVTSHLGKMWRSMRKEQKEKYVQRSRAISQKFKKENPRYIENQKNLNNINFLLKFNHKVQLKLSERNHLLDKHLLHINKTHNQHLYQLL